MPPTAPLRPWQLGRLTIFYRAPGGESVIRWTVGHARTHDDNAAAAAHLHHWRPAAEYLYAIFTPDERRSDA
jgi:hypothetical protein